MALLHFSFFSQTIGKNVQLYAAVPEIARFPDEKLKTVWLLHGWSGDYTDWTRQTGIERYANARKIAVIMPDASNSFYADMAFGPEYFTFLTKELLEYCRRVLPLSERREDNFVAGLSMGGYGALKLGLACPQQYAAIGCLSGYNIPEDFKEQVKTAREGWKRTMNIIYGDLFPDNMMGSVNDVYHLAEEILKNDLPRPRIYHLWGDNDVAKRGAEVTKKHFESLEGNPFDYQWHLYPGKHDWELWDAHVEEMLDYFGITEAK